MSCFILLYPFFAFAENFPAQQNMLHFAPINIEQAKLGRLLFYDPVLSATYKISCGSCHNHASASSNGFLLEGNYDIRQLPEYEKLKKSFRPSPALFNLGASEFTMLFADGRLRLEGKKIISPQPLPAGIDNLLQTQVFLALTSRMELAINSNKSNKELLAEIESKIQSLPNYLPYFQKAYPHIKQKSQITINEITGAIAAFVAYEWRADNSKFDKFLAGEAKLTKAQKKGMELFYGRAKCGTCHKGRLQSDHKLHNNIRTPSLRNIMATAPYGFSGGNAGEFATLQGFINHHARLSPDDLTYIIEFLATLTDEKSLAGRLKKPLEVPSFLVVE